MKKFLNLSILLLVVALAAFGQATTTSTTLSATVSANTTTQWCVASATGIVVPSLSSGTSGSILYVADGRGEAAQVTGSGSSATCFQVRRGQLGTTASQAHLSGATVYVGAAGTGSGDPSRPFTGAFVTVAPSGYCVASAQYTLPVIVTGTTLASQGRIFNCRNQRWVDETPIPLEVITGTAQAAGTSPSAATAVMTVTGGAGGAQSATTGNGAAGAAGTITGGVGGAGGSSSGTGGTGGALTFTAGAGGGTVTGGTGGTTTVKAGAGGNGSTAGGSGGTVDLQAGAAGSGGTGTAGKVRIKDATDGTKIAAFDVSGITTATTRTLTIPDANITLSGAKTYNCGTTTTANCTSLGAAPIVHSGQFALASASPSAATITGLSPAFTSSSSYVCSLSPTGATAAIAAGGLAITYVSGSSFTVTGPNTVTTQVNYVCIGN